MKDLGSRLYFLGIEVHSTSSILFLSQTKYIIVILQYTDMAECKPIATPMIVGLRFTQGGSLFSNSTIYCSIVGALQYLVITHLELTYKGNTVCHMHAPIDDHFRVVNYILSYVKGTLHFSLNLYSHPTR